MQKDLSQRSSSHTSLQGGSTLVGGVQSHGSGGAGKGVSGLGDVCQCEIQYYVA